MSTLKELVSKILLGSWILLTGAPDSRVEAQSNASNDPSGPQTQERASNQKSLVGRRMKSRMILKPAAAPDTLILASHSSHASHASHASHYSSAGGDTASAAQPPDKLAPAPIAPPSRTTYILGARRLEAGSQGPDVTELKRLLRLRGYTLAQTDVFDIYTTTVVKDFQLRSGLEPSGAVDRVTVSYLRVPVPTPQPSSDSQSSPVRNDTVMSDSLVSDTLGSRLLEKGMSGQDVMQLESLLVKHGYKLHPDSTFDDYTDIAVRDFQARYGVPVDGRVGPLTVYHLKHE